MCFCSTLLHCDINWFQNLTSQANPGKERGGVSHPCPGIFYLAFGPEMQTKSIWGQRGSVFLLKVTWEGGLEKKFLLPPRKLHCLHTGFQNKKWSSQYAPSVTALPTYYQSGLLKETKCLLLPRVKWAAISLWPEMNLILNADLFLLNHLATIQYLGIYSSEWI